MGLKSFAFAAVLTAVTGHCVAQGILQSRAWPEEAPCAATCTTLQFGSLELQLPKNEVAKFFVHAHGDPAVFLVGPSGIVGEAPILQAMPSERIFDRYRKYGLFDRPGIKTVGQYFDALGKPSPDDKVLTLARKVELIEGATAYTKATKGRIAAYRIDPAPPDEPRVYFVVDDDRGVYLLSGAVSAALYDAILANLRAVPVP